MIKKIGAIIGLLFLLFFLSKTASAQLRYPVAELGFCRDAKECYLYCQIPENNAACWSYGKYKLLSQVLGESDESDEQEAKRLGITFPIKELGSCGSVTACKAFCDVEANRNVCIDFARTKGIGEYKKNKDILETAKQKLGCDSYESCRNFCEKEENRERCMEIAEEHEPEEFKTKKQEMLNRARAVLGCDSFSSCRTFCENPANESSCRAFFEQHVPDEIKERTRHYEREKYQEMGLPCDSADSCRRYCEDPANREKCFRGQGGERIKLQEERRSDCKTEEECRKWCQENPNKCPGYGQSQDYKKYQEEQRYYEQYKLSPYPTFNYQEQPNYQNYTRPADQQQFPTSYEQQPQNYPTSPPQESQQSGSGGFYDPATECAKVPNCSWNGSSCQCPPQ